jgi:sensor histidine kinase YesM
MSKNIIVINIENTMNIQAKTQENGKTDNAVHGFGIPNMKNIVDKYHGEYRSLQAEGVYSVEMIMEMSSNTKKEV